MSFFDQIYHSVGSFSPNIFAALIILIVGWLVAIVISSLAHRALHRTGIGERVAGLMVGKEEARVKDVDKWIAKAIYYLILFFVLVAFLQTLGLTLAIEPINRLLISIFEFAPKLLAALILIAIAWIVATILKMVTRRALQAARVDDSMESQAALEKGTMPLSQTISEAVYWLVLLLFLPMVLDALSLGGLLAPLQLMLAKLLGFLPNLLAAAVILLVGWFVARILQRIVTNLLTSLGAERLSERVGLSKILGKQGLSGLIGLIVYILVLIPVILGALNALALDAITQPVSNMLNKLLSTLPDMFGAALILAVAYVLGRVVAELVTNLLSSIGFNSILVRLGLGKEVAEGERTPSEIVGYLVLVAIMLFAIIEAAQLLGFVVLADLVSGFTVFAGHVIMGLIIFAIGLYLANLAHRAVMDSGMSQAKILAMVARISILVFAGAMALRQMGLANEIINLAFGLLLGALAVALALAFGLGGREMAARELEKWTESFRSEKP